GDQSFEQIPVANDDEIANATDEAQTRPLSEIPEHAANNQRGDRSGHRLALQRNHRVAAATPATSPTNPLNPSAPPAAVRRSNRIEQPPARSAKFITSTP